MKTQPQMIRIPNGMTLFGVVAATTPDNLQLINSLRLQSQVVQSKIQGVPPTTQHQLLIAGNLGDGRVDIMFPTNILRDPLTDEQRVEYYRAWKEAEAQIAERDGGKH